MTPEQLRRAMEVFDEVCDLAPGPQAERLAQRCGDDESVHERVRRMLELDREDEGPVSGTGSGAGAEILAADLARTTTELSAVPEHIGPYRIIRELGRGGMGVVYEAEQENPRRHVALKIAQFSFATRELVARFEREAQVLGRLRHNGIAHIYESGTAVIGGSVWPYFVMELVNGVRIDEHVRRRGLSVFQRLELVARVCDAVHHAHQKGVIHRDLKPGNVLVVEESSAGAAPADPIGQPKVLDFGIARMTDPEAHTLRTSTGEIVGTLVYLSPEQLQGRSEDLDIRCDVYALGAILFEVLAGRPPHQVRDLPFVEAARVIMETDAPRLSALDRTLKGDVETIVATALERDRNRRYASAAQLAAELRRYLRSEPIEARPATTMYQFRKFAGRNKALVSGILIAFAALVLGLAAATAGLISARAESRARQIALTDAEAERETSDAVTEFFTEILLSARPDAQGRHATVREVMDIAAETVIGRFQRRPRVEAEIRQVIGGTYTSLGEYDKAHDQLQGAVRIWESIREPASPELLSAMSALGEAYYFQGQLDQAAKVFGSIRDVSRADPDLDPLIRIEATANGAFVAMQRGEFAESERLFQESIDLQSRAQEPDEVMMLTMRGNLAMLYDNMGRAAEAEQLYVEVLAGTRQLHGETSPETAQVMSNLAALYLVSGRIEPALPMLREALAIQEEALGASHSKTLVTLNHLADALRRDGQYEEAARLVGDGLARARAAYGEDDRSTLSLLLTLGRIQWGEGRLEQAIATLEAGLDGHRRSGDTWSFGKAYTYSDLASVYIEAGRYEEALRVARQMISDFEPLGSEHPHVRTGRLSEAQALAGLGRTGEAEAILTRLHDTATDPERAFIAAELERLRSGAESELPGR